MSYPVIARLGINQFWYKHWYSDTNSLYKFNTKQDRVITKLFKMYINYGATVSTPLFFNKKFFNKKFNYINLNTKIKNFKYYRRFYFSNESLSIEHSYLLRYRTGEYFPLRLWIIKYSNWILVCFNCFKPVKSKILKNKIFKKNYQALSTKFSNYNTNVNFRRYKLLFLYFKTKNFTKNSRYLF